MVMLKNNVIIVWAPKYFGGGLLTSPDQLTYITGMTDDDKAVGQR